MLISSSLWPRIARISALSKTDSVEGATLVEATTPFFHYDPVFVESGVADLAMPAPSPSWNKVRDRHSTYVRVTKDATVFGPNYVVDLNGRCYSESLDFRQGALEYYNKTMRHSHGADGPDVVFMGDGADIIWSDSSQEKIVDLGEPVILVTPFEINNWGRWVSHVIPKLMHISELGLTGKLLVRSQSPWQSRLLEIFGFGPDRIIPHDPNITYRSPSVTSFQHSSADFTVSPKELRDYDCIRSRFPAEDNAPKKLFLSRSSMAQKRPTYRRLINEDELLSALTSMGFVAFEPELHSFEKQVSWLSGADVVVGLGGAGMFNAVFCNSRAKVVTIESSSTFITSHTGIFASLGLWHGVIYGKPVDQSAGGAHATWRVDPAVIVATLARHKATAPWWY
jgi:hypothetical protein